LGKLAAGDAFERVPLVQVLARTTPVRVIMTLMVSYVDPKMATITPTITTGRAGSVGDAWTDDGEPDHLCPVALIAMGAEAEAAEHLQKLRTIHDNAAERVHDALRRSGHYHPAAGLDPDRLNGAEKLLVMASDGEAGAGNYAWPPALSDEEVTNTRHAIGQYLIEATAAVPAERQ